MNFETKVTKSILRVRKSAVFSAEPRHLRGSSTPSPQVKQCSKHLTLRLRNCLNHPVGHLTASIGKGVMVGLPVILLVLNR